MQRALGRPGPLGLIERHPLLTFYVLSCAIAWTAVIPYVLGAFPAPMLTCGPLIAALIITAATGGWQSTKKLLLRMVQWRVGVRWYAFALLPVLAMTMGAVYVNVQLGAPDPTPALLASLPSFVLIFLGLLLSPLSGAFGEEPGWRGYALPRLLSGRSPLATTLLLGLLVATWHGPLFVAGLYRPAWLHFAVIVTTTVIFMVLYLGSNGSVLLAMLLHAMMNAAPEFLFAPFTGPDLERALILYQVGSLALAGLVTLVAWPRLTRAHTSTGPMAATPAPAAA
jgi:membrane protease YdiL (CAAX protease family)